MHVHDTKQKLRKPINNFRVLAKHVINTVFPSPAIDEKNLIRHSFELDRMCLQSCRAAFCSVNHGIHQFKSLSENVKGIDLTLAPKMRREHSEITHLIKKQGETITGGEITWLKMCLHRSPVRHGYPLVFKQTHACTKCAAATSAVCNAATAVRFSIIIIIILVNPCSCFHFSMTFIVKVNQQSSSVVKGETPCSWP